MKSMESSPIPSLRQKIQAFRDAIEKSEISSRESSEESRQIVSMKRLKLPVGLPGMPQTIKRPSMIAPNIRMLESREMPRRDSIHHSLHFKRRFSGRHLTPIAWTGHRPRIKTSVNKSREANSEMGVRFVDPKALPDRVSPRRYGSKNSSYS